MTYTSENTHVWKTDKEIGYANFGRQWCVNCRLVRNQKHEKTECLGRCSVEVPTGAPRDDKTCRYAAVGFLDGSPVCSLHLRKHRAKSRKIEKLQQELARLQKTQ